MKVSTLIVEDDAAVRALIDHLAENLPRSINWAIMISEDTLFVTDERGQHELALEWLQGGRD